MNNADPVLSGRVRIRNRTEIRPDLRSIIPFVTANCSGERSTANVSADEGERGGRWAELRVMERIFHVIPYRMVSPKQKDCA